MDAKNNTIIPSDFKAIEQAGYLSWPALEQIDKEGWICRFANGYSKRANSVNVLSTDVVNVNKIIIECEKEYNVRNLPCIFRLLSFNDNSDTERILDQRGYGRGDHSLVLVQNLLDKAFESSQFHGLNCREWLPIYSRLNKKEPADQTIHMEMLNKIYHKTVFAVLRKDHIDLSCALGVLCNGYFGLFNMVTHPDYRDQGYGAELITGMLSWAKRQKATTAYLQVVSDNLPAVCLYEKIGYKAGYEYHYRIQNR